MKYLKILMLLGLVLPVFSYASVNTPCTNGAKYSYLTGQLCMKVIATACNYPDKFSTFDGSLCDYRGTIYDHSSVYKNTPQITQPIQSNQACIDAGDKMSSLSSLSKTLKPDVAYGEHRYTDTLLALNKSISDYALACNVTNYTPVKTTTCYYSGSYGMGTITCS